MGMSLNLNDSSILRTAPGLVISFGLAGQILMGLETEKRKPVSSFAFLLIEASRQPSWWSTIRDRLQKRHPNVPAQKVLMEAIRLVALGFLQVGEGETGAVFPRLSSPHYNRPNSQISCLNDVGRSQVFLAAIAAAVGPDDVVLDLGSGNGILALAAARAGARRVYAVEPSGFARLLPQVFADNGFADRIVTLRGRSQDVELPEQATVLLSELVSCEPLGEQVLEIVSDARRRHLSPEAKILPALTKIRGQIFRPDERLLNSHEFQAKNLGHWQDNYGFDFSALAASNPIEPTSHFLSPNRCAKWKPMSEKFELVEIDFNAEEIMSTVDMGVEIEIKESHGTLALVTWFAMDYGEGHWYENQPTEEKEVFLRQCQVWLLNAPKERGCPGKFRLRYTYGASKTNIAWTRLS